MYTKFVYSYIDTYIFDETKICGFSINMGSEWNDLQYCYLRRDGKVQSSTLLKLKRGLYKEFESILKKNSGIKQVSSWIYKRGEHISQHEFQIEVDGWNRDFGVYSFGELKGHLNKSYKEEEKIALNLFEDIRAFLLKQGYKLEYNSLQIVSGNNGNKNN